MVYKDYGAKLVLQVGRTQLWEKQFNNSITHNTTTSQTVQIDGKCNVLLIQVERVQSLRIVITNFIFSHGRLEISSFET